MKCPICVSVDLTMSDRQGVEIDFCPRCRGVWLDRGELDKLIERSTRHEGGYDDDDDDDRRRQHMPPPPPPPPGGYAGHQPYPPQGQYYPQKKRKSFWQEIFD